LGLRVKKVAIEHYANWIQELNLKHEAAVRGSLIKLNQLISCQDFSIEAWGDDAILFSVHGK
jgi:hypothetical protein